MARREVREFGAPEHRVELSNGTVVYVPGDVPGRVKQWLPQTTRGAIARMPAEHDEAEDFFDAALAEHEVVQQEILQLDLEGTPADDVAVIVPAGAAGPDGRRVLLYRDESGGFSWHFPATGAPARERREETGRERFIVPLRTGAARTSLARRSGATRGTLTKLGRKLFKVLILPLAPALLGRPLNFFVREWEERKRNEILRTLTPDDYRAADARAFTDWDRLASGRALLVVHGIFSSTRGMLSRLSKAQMEALHGRYDGRVLAFDHFTVSKSPEENAQDLVRMLRERGGGRRFTFDVLTHSRGGIVARTLREGTDTKSLADFRKIFFVAPPNHGSALANADRIVDMIDVFTNLITDFPDGPVAYSIEILLAVLKCAAFAGIGELGGIRDMQPGAGGYIERRLNDRYVNGLENYACVTARYDPDPHHDNGFFTGPFANAVIDRVFGRGVDNDLVVPTLGAFEKVGSQRRDIRSHTFPSGVWHTAFFANEETVKRALEHFERDDVVEDEEEAFSFDDTLRSLDLRKVGTTVERTTVERTTEAAAEVPEAAEPALLRRNPEIDFPPAVIAGMPEKLTLSLEAVAQGAAAAINLMAAPGVDAIEVRARVFAPGFDVTPDVHTMTLRRARIEADEKRVFELVAHAVDAATPRTITAEFAIGTVPVGGISHVTVVVPQPGRIPERPQPPTEPHFTMAAAQRDRCDLKITVAARRGTTDEVLPPFPLSITSAVPGFSYDDFPAGDFTPTDGDVAEYLQTTLGEVLSARPRPDDFPDEEQLVAATQTWNGRMTGKLHSYGTELWQRLPEAFRTRYFEHVDRNRAPKSILISSHDMYFPWELVIPWRMKADGNREVFAPLGQAHILGRWRPGLASLPEPQQYALRRVALLHPEYPEAFRLVHALEEGAELQTLFGAKAFRVDPATEEGVQQQLLEANDVQLVHFCGHAEFNARNPDQSRLLLADETGLTALDLSTSDLTGGRPFIVLNACSVGQPGVIASRAGGFAARCLDRGCSAVLAAYWPISDRSAKEFSLALYRKLRFGHSVGEALQELRFEHAGNPTYQAYTFFGDPLARLLF